MTADPVVAGERYQDTPVMVRVCAYEGSSDFDEALVVDGATAKRLGIGSGSRISLEDEWEGLGAGEAPAVAVVDHLSHGRTGERVLFCQWWRRRVDAEGRRIEEERRRRPELLT